MRALILPDIHLKPGVFKKATKILESGQADFAVQLGDLLDDWGEEFNIGLYERTLKEAIAFHKKFPNTLWCMGNHDFGYHVRSYGARESGHSQFVEGAVSTLLEKMLDEGIHQRVMHIVDNCIFSHAGVTEEYIRYMLPEGVNWDEDDAYVLDFVGGSSPEDLWQEFSPIWVRPQGTAIPMWHPDKLQVVGHTPVRTATEENGVLSTDVFSTYRNGAPYGDRRFVIVDTVTKRWYYAEEDE